MKTLTLTLALALFLFISVAHAESSDKWEGFYAGASAVSVDTDLTTRNQSNSGLWFPVGEDMSFDGESVQPGVQVGYQLTNGNFLYGLEASMIPGAKSNRVRSPWVGWHTFKMSVKNQTLLGARFGYLWNDWLVFAKGGYAGAEVRFQGADWRFTYNHYDQSKWHHGWHAGAGLEYFLTDHVIAGFDYTHTALESSTEAVEAVPSGQEFEVKAKTDAFAFRLSYKF